MHQRVPHPPEGGVEGFERNPTFRDVSEMGWLDPVVTTTVVEENGQRRVFLIINVSTPAMAQGLTGAVVPLAEQNSASPPSNIALQTFTPARVGNWIWNGGTPNRAQGAVGKRKRLSGKRQRQR